MSHHIETVQAIYGAFARGDVPGILAHLADDVAWDQDTPSWGLPWYEPRAGRDQVPAFFEALLANVELARFEPRNLLAGGDQVAAVISISVVVKGRQVDDLELHLWTFGDDGKVTRFAHVLDRHAQVAAWRGIDP
ncbi:MAG: nuclear transport factor 2 family protein [Thermoleophilia bacterium]